MKKQTIADYQGGKRVVLYRTANRGFRPGQKITVSLGSYEGRPAVIVKKDPKSKRIVTCPKEQGIVDIKGGPLNEFCELTGASEVVVEQVEGWIIVHAGEAE